VGLLLLLVLGVVQVALLLHVRAVVTADAAEGARAEANAGAPAGSGGRRAADLVGAGLGSRISGPLACASSRDRVDAAPVVTVTCEGELRLWLLPLTVHLRESAHALREGP